MSKVSEKFSIIKTVVYLEKLNEEIDKYRLVNEENPYIFMNKGTLDEVKEEFENAYGMYVRDCDLNENNITIAVKPSIRYCGCKVFQDDTLKFGVIEIR